MVVGSGIAAQQLSDDVGLQLLENSTATVLGLTVLILMFGPVSGAHFNPVVSLADWFLGRRTGTGLSLVEVAAYAGAQVLGGDRPVRCWPTRCSTWAPTSPPRIGPQAGTCSARSWPPRVWSRSIFALARTGRGVLAAPAVGAYIGAAYWFTSSTSFANPAVTIGRMFSDTFAGIAPASVPAFVAAQLVGLVIGLALTLALYPDAGTTRRRRRRAARP